MFVSSHRNSWFCPTANFSFFKLQQALWIMPTLSTLLTRIICFCNWWFFVDIFIFASSYIQNLNLSLFNWGLVWPSNFNNVAPNKVQLSHKKAVQFKTVHCSFSIFDANCKWNHANKNVSQHIRGWISHLVNKSSYWFWWSFRGAPPPHVGGASKKLSHFEELPQK